MQTVLQPPTATAAVPAPVNTVPPAVTGTPNVGEVLTTTDGTWENSPTGFSYQWLRNDDGIGTNPVPVGTDQNTYTTVAGDDNKFISCEVTATNAGGSTAAMSNYVEITAVGPTSAYKVGTFLQGTTSVTGLGFTPVGVLFFSSGVGDGEFTSITQGFGACDANTQFTVGGYSLNSVATATSASFTRDDACIVVRTSSEAFRYSFASLDADGFTLNLDFTDGATNRPINYIAFGGIDFAIKPYLTKTTTGADPITGLSFSPTAILRFGANAASGTLPSFFNSWIFGMGMSSGPTEQFAVSTFSDNGVGLSNTSRLQRNDETISQVYRDESQLQEADLQSLDANGWTYNYTTPDGAQRHEYALCFGGLSKVVTEIQPASTGPAPPNTAVGFQPKALIAIGNGRDLFVNEITCAAGFGASDGTLDKSNAFWDQDGVGTMNTSRRTTSGLIGLIASSQVTGFADAAVQSLNADGFTLNWTAADSTQRRFGILCLG